jgi:hypothetical protein
MTDLHVRLAASGRALTPAYQDNELLNAFSHCWVWACVKSDWLVV